MRILKALMFGAILGAMAIPSFGALTNCGTVTLDTLLSGGTNAAGCQVTDKMFTNFSYTGNLAASAINVTFQSNGPVPAGASVAFQPQSGVWSSIVVTWTTTIDAAVCANCNFLAVLDQIFTPPTPNTNTGTFSHSVGGSVNVSGGAPGTLSGQANIPNGVVQITTTFTQTGGTTLQGVQSTFSQYDATIPEPTSFALMGLGLLGLGVIRRKLS